MGEEYAARGAKVLGPLANILNFQFFLWVVHAPTSAPTTELLLYATSVGQPLDRPVTDSGWNWRVPCS